MSEIYERNINIGVSRENEHEIVTRASMLDLNHHIRVELRINLPTEAIVDAEAQMVKAPYGLCQLTLTNIKKLIGLKIERGINKRIVDALGHSEGCTHMVDLSMEAVRLSANVMVGLTKVGDEWFHGTGSDEERIARVKPILKDSCLPFKES
ncbi:MAG: DUF2889 domain-containing protein [Bacteroidota bacterium]